MTRRKLSNRISRIDGIVPLYYRPTLSQNCFSVFLQLALRFLKIRRCEEKPAGGRPRVFNKSAAHSTTHFTPLTFAFARVKVRSTAQIRKWGRPRLHLPQLDGRGAHRKWDVRCGEVPDREQQGTSSKSLHDSAMDTESHHLLNAVTFGVHQPQRGSGAGGGGVLTHAV